MNGNQDPDDVTLADGNGYFVCWAEFEDYLKVASLTPEEVSSQIRFRPHDWCSQKSACNHLKAVIMQNVSKFKNKDVSGVFAVQCARH